MRPVARLAGRLTGRGRSVSVRPADNRAFAGSSTILERNCFISFRLSGHRFALALTVVREVAPFCTLARPPACPPVLEGVLNLAGQAIPVLRLDRLLALSEITPHISSCLLIVEEMKGRLALLVDEVTGIEELNGDQLLPVSAAATFNGCVIAQSQSGGEPLSVLSLERLMVRRERETIFHFASYEQQRARLLTGTAQ